jgi:hypothetical protein
MRAQPATRSSAQHLTATTLSGLLDRACWWSSTSPCSSSAAGRWPRPALLAAALRRSWSYLLRRRPPQRSSQQGPPRGGEGAELRGGGMLTAHGDAPNRWGRREPRGGPLVEPLRVSAPNVLRLRAAIGCRSRATPCSERLRAAGPQAMTSPGGAAQVLCTTHSVGGHQAGAWRLWRRRSFESAVEAWCRPRLVARAHPSARSSAWRGTCCGGRGRSANSQAGGRRRWTGRSASRARTRTL